MKNKKVIGNLLFLLLCIGLTVYYVFKDQDLETILGYLENAQWGYWIISVVCIVIFTCSESVIIHYMLKSLGYKPRLARCCIYSFVGFFFSLITPSATGGQPMQVVFMKKDQIPIHASSLVLLIVTITYKIVLIAVGAVVLIVRPSSVIEYLEPVMGWMYLGMALNVAFVAGLVILIFNQKLAKGITKGIIRIVGKFIKSKKITRVEGRIDKTMESYADKAEYLRTNKGLMLKVMGLSFVQRFFMFFVTWLACKSFGIDDANLLVVVTLQAMISLAADMLPFPGGVGISEHLFTEIFTTICGSTLTIPVMVVSRGVSYYSEIIICAIFTIIGYFWIMEGKKKDDRDL